MSARWQHEVGRIPFTRLVNAVFHKYETLDFGNLSWATGMRCAPRRTLPRCISVPRSNYCFGQYDDSRPSRRRRRRHHQKKKKKKTNFRRLCRAVLLFASFSAARDDFRGTGFQPVNRPRPGWPCHTWVAALPRCTTIRQLLRSPRRFLWHGLPARESATARMAVPHLGCGPAALYDYSPTSPQPATILVARASSP